MSDERLDPRRVQQVLVGMLFDPGYAARVLGPRSLPELSAAERALLRQVDARALRSDPHRIARAVHAIVDEYPVSAALIGVAKVESFFASEEFRAGLRQRQSMALGFAAWLRDRARGVGLLEGTMAALRRPIEAAHGEIVCSPTLRGLVLPEGTLAFSSRVRQQLGPQPIETLAQRREPWPERPPKQGREHVLVERRDDGSIDLGTASEPLVRLLRFAEAGRSRAEVEARAVRLGAEVHEARELVDGLVAEGLLRATGIPPRATLE